MPFAVRLVLSFQQGKPISIRIGMKGVLSADLAEALYSQKPKKYNCAQAVVKTFGRDDLVETMKCCGGGRAPEGLCGALHAALLILSDEKQEVVKKEFQQATGDIQCRSIRQVGKTSCTEFVRIVAGVLEKHQKYIEQ